MKALTVLEPWASLLAAGVKGYETRSWQPPATVIKQQIAIHAGMGGQGLVMVDRDARLGEICDRRLGYEHIYGFGRILAVARIAFVIPSDGLVARALLAEERALGDWSPGRFGWRIDQVCPLPRPVPCRGRQRLWTLPAEVEQLVREQL
jgi:hypothetical protein